MRTAPFVIIFSLLSAPGFAQSEQVPVEPEAFRSWAAGAYEQVTNVSCSEVVTCWTKAHWLIQLDEAEVERYINGGEVSMDNLFRHVEGFLSRSG